MSQQEKEQYIALDCEMVGVGYGGYQSALARVSVVDWDGHVLLDEYVQPDEPVTDYRTFVSGITPQHLQDYATHTLATIRPVVAELLQNRILVGHGLKNDLHVLQLHHPWYDIRDTAKYEPLMQVRFNDGVLWPRKLRDLCTERHIKVNDKDDTSSSSTFQQGMHCSVQDAIAAMKLYQCVRTKFDKVMEYKKSKTMQILKMTQQPQNQPHQDQMVSLSLSDEEESISTTSTLSQSVSVKHNTTTTNM
jgi:RNA exonuclease 4